MNRLD
jgi:alkyldihydroxyacetonephosphate synthase